MAAGLKWATLPLLELISVHPEYWVCSLCEATGTPGSGQSWRTEAVEVAMGAGITHLRGRHYLREVTQDAAGGD